MSKWPPTPADEQERLAELVRMGVLDSAPEDEFDRLAQLASIVCGTPMATLTFIDSGRQWHKARVGVPVAETPRAQALCAQAVLEPGLLLEIKDTSSVGWFDPFLYGRDRPPVAFYAAAPLRTRAGSAIGTLCVMDHVPRSLSAAQRDALGKLSQAAASALATRAQLRVATQQDRLTGLPNWFHFEAKFEELKPRRGIFAFVRLRTVSQINSAHGFRVADSLIKQAADRLRSLKAHGAIMARVKRGLFIIFFPDVAPDEFGRTVAPALTADLFVPYNVNHLTLVCPVNLGFSTFPDDGASLDEAVNAADAALQTAIEREESVAFFDRSVDNRLSRYYRLEPQLREALTTEQFVNYYQPKVDLLTGRIVGVEALVRWVHPERGLVPPMDFIPALESTGLIREVGDLIIRRAVADWATWREAGLEAPRVAVNVAAAQLRGADFIGDLRRALEPIGGDTQALGIEVTESVLISNMESAVAVLSQVRQLGIPVAIDDFGTGYSSLAYIVTLPIDELKIDRAFVMKVAEDEAYKGIVSTCISLAHNLKLKVVAEGVETDVQRATLKALDCDQGQGYFYSPPIPADRMAALLRDGFKR